MIGKVQSSAQVSLHLCSIYYIIILLVTSQENEFETILILQNRFPNIIYKYGQRSARKPSEHILINDESPILSIYLKA